MPTECELCHQDYDKADDEVYSICPACWEQEAEHWTGGGTPPSQEEREQEAAYYAHLEAKENKAMTMPDLDNMDAADIDGMEITSPAMAAHVLNKGYAITTTCGPLSVYATAEENPGIIDCQLCVYNTLTGSMMEVNPPNKTVLLNHCEVFAVFGDGAWKIHYPPEP